MPDDLRSRYVDLWRWWHQRHDRRSDLYRQFMVEATDENDWSRFSYVRAMGEIEFADGRSQKMQAVGRDKSDAIMAWVRKGDRKNLWRLVRRLVYLE